MNDSSLNPPAPYSPVHPLITEVLKGARQAVAVVNGDELPLSAAGISAHQDVATIAVRVAQTQVQDCDLVHLMHGELAVATLLQQ